MKKGKFLMPLLSPPATEEECYNAGYDAGMNGPNTTNSHYNFFSTEENTAAWERGMLHAKQGVKKTSAYDPVKTHS